MSEKKIFQGNLIVREGETLVADYEEVTGYVDVSGSAKLEALTTVGGNVYVSGSAKLEALTTVGGNVYVSGSAKLEAPALTTVGGNVDVSGSAKLEAPALTTVGGYVDVSGSAKLEALTTVGGNVYVSGSAKLEAPALTTVGGNVYVSGSAKLEALTTVGGYVDVYGSAKLDAPNLKEKDTPEARAKALAALDSALKERGMVLADGILAHVINERGNVSTIRRIGSDKREFLVRDGEYSAHGATLAEAMADLKYKRTDRDTSQFKAWKPETEVTLDDAILAYRSITGACAAGVRGFCEGRELPERLTVRRAIDETRGQYGSDEFKRFFEVGA
jgi:formylmethanofuran dehydrogenase subunit C